MTCGFCGGEAATHDNGREFCVTCDRMTDACICWHPDYDSDSKTLKPKEQ